MTGAYWLKLANTFTTDPKILEVGEAAAWLYLAGLCYSSSHLTDGVVPKSIIGRLVDGDAEERAAALVEAGLWNSSGKNYLIHNYTEHQQTSDQIQEKRDAAAKRQAKHRQKETLVKTEEGEVLDAAEVRRRLTTVCDKVVEDGNLEATLEGYRHIYTNLVPQAVEKYREVSGIGEASLLNVVATHAAQTFIGEDLDSAAFRRLSALRRDNGFRLIEVLPIAAAGAKGDPITYLTGILNKEKTNVR